MRRFIRVLITFIIWLIPISGMYWGIKILSPEHHTLGLIIAFISGIVLMPCSGFLFDALTNDRVLFFNVDKPWKSHLK
jgi:hypothetical protein